MLRKKAFWITIVAVIVLGGGGFAAYKLWLAPQQPTAEGGTTLQTSVATIGDISVTASGSGVLVPSSTANLAFTASGTVEQINVKVGDRVQEGDVLAVIDDTAARQAVDEAEQAVMSAKVNAALASTQAELNVAQAQADLATAQDDLDSLQNPDSVELSQAKADLASAQSTYRTASAKANMTDEQNASVRISLDQATAALAEAQQAYAEAMNPERDWEQNIESTRESAASSLVRAQQDLEIAQANHDLATVETSSADAQTAWAQVLSARETVTNLEDPTDEQIAAAQLVVKQNELALQQAQLEMNDGDQNVAQRSADLVLEQAQLNLATAQAELDGTVLIAPFSGTVVEIDVAVGESASGTAIVLADLANPIVEFWVEESDLMSVAVGNAIDIVFDALPDLTFSGEIYQIDPQLVTVSNTPAVQAWATIDTSTHPVTLLGQMNGDVDIVAGQATGVVLVPVEAVRSLGNDQYAVFVVNANGQTEMRTVEVGLSDYVNTEIVSGLQAGETVLLSQTSPTSSTTTDSGFPAAGGFPMNSGGGGFPGGGGGGMP